MPLYVVLKVIKQLNLVNSYDSIEKRSIGIPDEWIFADGF